VDAKTRSKILEERRRQALCEDICKLLSTGYLEDANTAKGYLLAHEVYVQLDMLRALVMDRIPQHVDARDVVTVDYRGCGHRALSSRSSCRSQVHSAMALVTPRYSAFSDGT
jgi:hypothetical protein